ncbi:ribosome biogenesis GTPase Der [Helicobacter sp. 13S00401-1]|nr:ribosome biogenesis GTPase Der [Helicobacter sp. 13S00401-1]
MGAPNVGKSSLFNRIARLNIAITSHISSTTRDINARVIKLNNTELVLQDTGGLDDKVSIIGEDITANSLEAGLKSDLILYIIDGQKIALDEDIKTFRKLSQKVPSLLVVNKVDSDKIALEALNETGFSAFGVDFINISVAHNRGISKLLDLIESSLAKFEKANKKKPNSIDSTKTNTTSNIASDTKLQTTLDELDFLDYLKEDEDLDVSQEDTKEFIEPSEIKIAIIGKVNVGKSSLLNALTLKNRSLVSPMAGTTIDPVDEVISYEDKSIRFIDTAGIRRKGKIEGIEKYALMRTKEMLKDAHIALLVLDGSEPLSEQDEKISSLASEAALGVIVVINKWDKRQTSYEDFMKEYRYKFRFLEYAPAITLSALTHKRVENLKPMILEVFKNFCFRFKTSALNEIVRKALIKHPLPSDHGRMVKIYYATQYGVMPPQISLSMNIPEALHFSYKRYLVNTLRREASFEGVPILIESRSRNKLANEDDSKE